MPTYFARQTHTYAGVNLFTLTFPYLDEDHVEATVAGVAATSITFITPTTIRIDAPLPASGNAIIIRRRTSQSTRLVDYEGDSVLTETNLDNDSLQAFYMAQEAMDRAEQAFALAGGSGY